MEKRTKIIVIVVVLFIIGVSIGLVLGLSRSRSSSIELEVWPRSKDQLFQYASDAASRLTWNNRLKDFLKEYHEYTAGVERMACSYDDKQIFREKQVCDVPLDDLNPCAGSSDYQSTSTCVFLRLSQMSNWTPELFNYTLPDQMPGDLQNYIKLIHDRPEVKNVWVSCEGENPADNEYIGPLQYLPGRGFPAYYFPYTHKEGYLSPLVAVWFERPKTGILINVVCTAWARNIKNDEEEQQGTAHFSIMVD